jgi:arylsulfatase A-like enzyme
VLRDLKLEKNTLVFFCSDNGAQEVPGASNKPLRDFKGTLWEGGHRVPAIAWWPGQIPEGIVIHQPVMTMDIMPTLMELAGAEAPPEHKLDGVSLASLLQANQPLPARKLFWGKGGMLAMRDGKWKLVIDGKKISLFDVESDISEEKDLAAQQPERVKTIQMLVERWQQEVSVEKNSDVKVKKGRKSGKTKKDDA